jgi:hypothetical protein
VGRRDCRGTRLARTIIAALFAFVTTAVIVGTVVIVK